MGMKPVLLRLTGASIASTSWLRRWAVQAIATFGRLKKSEVAEALIATWCVEFLRLRRFGGFNVVEILVISILMLGVKAIITEAGRRRHNGDNRSYSMQTAYTRVGKMAYRNDTPDQFYRPQYSRFD